MGLFDFLSEETDQKNEFKPTSFDQTSAYNANNFQYGGREGFADWAATNYGNMGRDAQQRQAAQAQFQGANLQGANYGQTDADRALGMQARDQQAQAAGLMMGRATGAVPSIAGMQAQQDMQRAAAAQASAAASARGPAGLALAQQTAANNTANAQSQISNQAQVNVANERLAAEQAAFGAYGGIRGGDAAAQQMSAQRAQYDAGAANQMNQFNAQGQNQMSQFNVGAQMQQRQMNDAFQSQMEQNAMAVRQQQMQGQMAQQGLLAGSQAQGQQLAAGVQGQNAQTNSNMFNTILGTAVGAATMASDARAKVGIQPVGGGMLSDVTTKVGVAQAGGPSDDYFSRTMAQYNGVRAGDRQYADQQAQRAQGRQMMVNSFGGQRGGGGMGAGLMVGLGGGGAHFGGTFGGGADAIKGGGMDTQFGSKWNNSEIRGMSSARGMNSARMGGGMGGMLSDDRTKLRDHERQAYLLGRAHGVEQGMGGGGGPEWAYGGKVRGDEEIVDRDPWQSDARRAEATPEWLSDYMGGNSGRAGLAMGLAPLSDRAGQRASAGFGEGLGRDASAERSELPRSSAGDHYAMQADAGGGAVGDRMTGQLARGLAPYAYEYKPGFGTDGQKVGPMAQDMAANDVTATAVRQDPQSGLLSIDRDDGLKVALGGVGHLAAKQEAQDQAINELLSLAYARRQRRGF